MSEDVAEAQRSRKRHADKKENKDKVSECPDKAAERKARAKANRKVRSEKEKQKKKMILQKKIVNFKQLPKFDIYVSLPHKLLM